jgi:O-antigen/teichoic acid export membrane protein
MIPADPDKVRFNEKLDHLQARRPFTYNLATGALIGVVLLLLGFHWAVVIAYALSWAAVRWFLWKDGRILQRQYEARQVRVAAEKEAKRRRR